MDNRTKTIGAVLLILILAVAAVGYAINYYAEHKGGEVDPDYLVIEELETDTIQYNTSHDLGYEYFEQYTSEAMTTAIVDGSELVYIVDQSQVKGNYYLTLVSYTFYLTDGTIMYGTVDSTGNNVVVDKEESTVVTGGMFKMYLDTLKPVNDKLTFTIAGQVMSDSALPVVGGTAPADVATIEKVDVKLGIIKVENNPVVDISISCPTATADYVIGVGDVFHMDQVVKVDGVQQYGYAVSWNPTHTKVIDITDLGRIEGLEGSASAVPVSATFNSVESNIVNVYVQSAYLTSAKDFQSGNLLRLAADGGSTTLTVHLAATAGVPTEVTWTSTSALFSIDSITDSSAVVKALAGSIGESAMITAKVSTNEGVAYAFCRVVGYNAVPVLEDSFVLAIHGSAKGIHAVEVKYQVPGTTLTWAPATGTYVDVDSNGKVTAKAEGSEVITASYTVDGQKYTAATTVKVVDVDLKALDSRTSAEIDPNAQVARDGYFVASASVAPEFEGNLADITWSVWEYDDVLPVPSTKLRISNTEGATTVVIGLVQNTDVAYLHMQVMIDNALFTADYQIDVSVPVVTITDSAGEDLPSVSMITGDEITIKATVTDTFATEPEKELVWTSSDSTKVMILGVTIGDEMTAKALEATTRTVIVTATYTEDGATFKDTVAFVVRDPSVQLDTYDVGLKMNSHSTEAYVVNVLKFDGREVVATDEIVVTVNGSSVTAEYAFVAQAASVPAHGEVRIKTVADTVGNATILLSYNSDGGAIPMASISVKVRSATANDISVAKGSTAQIVIDSAQGSTVTGISMDSSTVSVTNPAVWDSGSSKYLLTVNGVGTGTANIHIYVDGIDCDDVDVKTVWADLSTTTVNVTADGSTVKGNVIVSGENGNVSVSTLDTTKINVDYTAGVITITGMEATAATPATVSVKVDDTQVGTISVNVLSFAIAASDQYDPATKQIVLGSADVLLTVTHTGGDADTLMRGFLGNVATVQVTDEDQATSTVTIKPVDGNYGIGTLTLYLENVPIISIAVKHVGVNISTDELSLVENEHATVYVSSIYGDNIDVSADVCSATYSDGKIDVTGGASDGTVTVKVGVLTGSTANASTYIYAAVKTVGVHAPYTVTYTITGGEAISPGTVKYHEAFTSPAIVADSSHRLPLPAEKQTAISITMGAESFTDFSYDGSVISIAAGKITGDLTIAVECIAVFSVTIQHGTVSPATVDSAASQQTFTITADEGYQLPASIVKDNVEMGGSALPAGASVTYDAGQLTINLGSDTFSGAITFTSGCTPITYTVTLTEGGTIDVSSVNATDSTQTITIAPTAGTVNSIASLTMGGVDIKAKQTLTSNAITIDLGTEKFNGNIVIGVVYTFTITVNDTTASPGTALSSSYMTQFAASGKTVTGITAASMGSTDISGKCTIVGGQVKVDLGSSNHFTGNLNFTLTYQS